MNFKRVEEFIILVNIVIVDGNKKKILGKIPANFKPIGWILVNNIVGKKGQSILGTGKDATISAELCYLRWLHHLSIPYQLGYIQKIPDCVAELGPGEALGIGIAALISGVKKYYAFDVIKTSSILSSLDLFDGIADLFINKSTLGNKVNFPYNLFTDQYLEWALAEERLSSLKREIYNSINNTEKGCISYFAPWDKDIIPPNSVDFIISQAVLEHIDELEEAYSAMSYWMKPNGLMSHFVDFQSHGTSIKWNGHWLYSDRLWKVIRGRAVFLINRKPYSYHIYLLKKYGFEIIHSEKNEDDYEICTMVGNDESFKLTKEDLCTKYAHIWSIKAK